MRIIFMGTPDFAVPTLDALVKKGYNVVAVITATDKMGGRGNKKVLQSAVKKYAVANDIPVLQPKNLKHPDFIETLKSYQADLQIVVAFRMLPVVVWDMPPKGTFNLHASLLPKYRGAAPINWAIINGEKETGLTTFFLQHEIDTGNVLFQEKIAIENDETAGSLHDKLMVAGASLVLKTVQAIEENNYEPKKQDDALVSHAPKIFSDTCEINFDQSTQKTYDFIRGLSPYPTAWTTLDDLKLKIYDCRPEKLVHEFRPGSFHTDGSSYFKIATQDGFILVSRLQLQGRRQMKIKDFLNGYRFKD